MASVGRVLRRRPARSVASIRSTDRGRIHAANHRERARRRDSDIRLVATGRPAREPVIGPRGRTIAVWSSSPTWHPSAAPARCTRRSTPPCAGSPASPRSTTCSRSSSTRSDRVVGARYAALGIVDADGRIEKFITSGIDEATRERIGPLPEGRGLLGLIIRENRSFRIPDIGADPRGSGFPPNHPPMTSFLGVPITVKGVSLGRLYLTDKIGATEFSAEDQALVETFALHAGIAMENARLHEQLQRLAVIDERDRISKDLHDGIIQNMYAVSLSLEDVPELMDERPGRRGSAGRAGDRLDPPVDPGHPQLHLRPAARAPRGDVVGRRARRPGRGMAAQHDDRPRAARPGRPDRPAGRDDRPAAGGRRTSR